MAKERRDDGNIPIGGGNKLLRYNSCCEGKNDNQGTEGLHGDQSRGESAERSGPRLSF
jgi:hypothetical protein